MSELKTHVNDADVSTFIDTVDDEQKKADSYILLETFTRISGEQAKMWGPSIIGFGSYHYKSDRSSQEGDWPLTGFSPRKQNLTIYFMNGFDTYTDLLQKLGKHKTSKGCLYIKKLADVDQSILEDLIKDSYLSMKVQHTS
ncbi:MAG: DUF1801 domain-containing protein [Candidatus Saccharimonadales bacterium]